MTWLLRRIKLAVDRYGGDSRKLQFIFLSATCGNPRQLAKKLASLKPTQRDPKPLLWIRKSGAAVPPRQVIVTQPSYNLTADTARIIQFLLAQGKSGIAFCNSRRSVRDLTGLLKTPQVAAFYSGITAERRAAVIEELQQGTIRWLIATEALEAGIDLPALEYCVMRGYSGSKMAYQQRSGRAGRSKPGLTVLIPNALSAIECLRHATRTLHSRTSRDANHRGHRGGCIQRYLSHFCSETSAVCSRRNWNPSRSNQALLW